VLFEDCDGDALACEKVAEHDAGRASTDDATGGGERVGRGRQLEDEASATRF
jgi:hypothetical protein